MCRLFIIAGLLLVFRQLPPVGVAVDLVLELFPKRLRGRRLLSVRGDGVGHIRAVGGVDPVCLGCGQVNALGRRRLDLRGVRRDDRRGDVPEIRAVGQDDRDCLGVAVDDSGNAVDHKRGNLRRVLDRCAGIVFKLRVDVDIARRHDERQCAFVDRNRCRTGRLEAVLERTCDQLLAVVRLDGRASDGHGKAVPGRLVFCALIGIRKRLTRRCQLVHIQNNCCAVRGKNRANFAHALFCMKDLIKAHPEIPSLTPHELRHTRATLWSAQGVPQHLIADLLGHCDTRMLERVYNHTTTDTLRQALEAVQTKEGERA